MAFYSTAKFFFIVSIFFILFVSIVFRKSYEHLQYFLLVKLLSTYVLRTKTVDIVLFSKCTFSLILIGYLPYTEL